VVRNAKHDEITPSAVYFSAAGDKTAHTVGKRAKFQLKDRAGRVAIEFKTHMGDSTWKGPEGLPQAESAYELSAKVLLELRNSLNLHADLPPMHAAVITVPAAFTNDQYRDTERAAEKAGLLHWEIRPEPVAAALAFGRAADTRHNPLWLAYDLGGGTFDAALVRGEDGIFTILDHAGNRNLGGKDFDEKIMEELIAPKLPVELRDQLERNSSLWWRLKMDAEDAKCELSTSNSASVGINLGDHDLEFVLRRKDVEPLQAKVFGETLEICRELIERNDLSTADIEKVLLVGGQTLSPSLRHLIQHGGHGVRGLGIPLDCSVNPMTAVAEGAALYAASYALPATVSIPKQAESSEPVEAEISIGSHVVGDDQVLIPGRLKALAPHKNVDNRWRVAVRRLDAAGAALNETELSPVSTKGQFGIPGVPLQKGRNELVLVVYDEAGVEIPVANASFAIVRDVAVHSLTINHGIGVASREGETVWFFEKGDALPNSKTIRFNSTAELRRGSNDVLKIPVVTGSQSKAVLNRPIYTLVISARDASATIPEGAELRLEIEVNESQRLKIRADFEEYDFIVEADATDSPVTSENVREKLDLLDRELEPCRRIVDRLPEIADATAAASTKADKAKDLLQQGSESNRQPWDAALDYALSALGSLYKHSEVINEELAWEPHGERCDKNVVTADNIVSQTPGLSREWMDRWSDLRSQYDNACERRDAARAYELAYTILPGHFETAEALQDRVRANTGQGVRTADRIGDQDLTGDVEKVRKV